MRDPQVENVYSAERVAFEDEGFTNTLTKKQVENKVWDVLGSDFVANLIEENDFVKEVSEDFLIITNDKRYKYSQANVNGIVFADGARSLIILLHEIAHSLTMSSFETGFTPSGEEFTCHGPHFAFVYLELVQEFLGIDAGLDLIAGFITFGVDFTPKEVRKKI